MNAVDTIYILSSLISKEFSELQEGGQGEYGQEKKIEDTIKLVNIWIRYLIDFKGSIIVTCRWQEYGIFRGRISWRGLEEMWNFLKMELRISQSIDSTRRPLGLPYLLF